MEEKEIWKTKFSILDKRIKHFLDGYRQNIALLGNDEEEILYLLEDYFQKNKSEELTHVHIRCSYADPKEIFKKAVFSLLSSYQDKVDSLDNLINCASTCADNTTNFIKDILKRKTISFLDILEVINKFINDTKRKCVFIIEEFLFLEEIFPDFFKSFSKFIILQRNCMVILTSSKSGADKVLSTELNLLFGNFEKLNLDTSFFLNHYRYLIKCIHPLNPSPFFLSFFVKIIGSNIIYYDLMADFIKKNYHDSEEVSIVSAIEEALYLRETYFFQRFIKKIDLIHNYFRTPLALKILVSLSDGYIRKKELVSLCLCDLKQLNNKLQKLCDLNYVENLGNIYRIKDTLFAFWLSHIFKMHHCFITLNHKMENDFWRKKMYETITLFKEEFLKDKIEKVVELVSSFKDDILKMGKSRVKLPSMERTKIISYPNKFLHLIVGEGKDITFIGVKEIEAEDNDIIEFLERANSIKTRNVRKIFISLERFSPSAKLIAKNNRLTIWDINEVNSLLSLYNKPILSLDKR